MTPVLSTLLLAGALLGATAGWPQDAKPARPSVFAPRVDVLREAIGSCAWGAVRSEAEAIREAAPRGGEPWLEASWALVRAHHAAWDPERLEAAARDALVAAAEPKPADPAGEAGGGGLLDPYSQKRVLEIENHLALFLQGRGLHAETLRHLRLVMDDLQRIGVPGGHELMTAAAIETAWSLRALGRREDARSMMESLRQSYPAAFEAAVATVILENDLGPAGYAGKYQGDAAQVRRLEAVWAARAPAGLRIAAALAIDAGTLPATLVGVADRPPSLVLPGAITVFNPRRPGNPPVVVVFSEGLALRALDAEAALVHELAHAVPAVRWGMRHEALPAWMGEALAVALAREGGELVEVFLSRWLLADRTGFLREDFWRTHGLSFESSPCGGERAEFGLLGLYLAEAAEARAGGAQAPGAQPGGAEAGEPGAGKAGKRGADKGAGTSLSRFAAEMEAGKDAEAASRAAYGLGIEELRRKAAEHALARLAAARERCLPAVASLVRAREGGAAEVIEACERALAAGAEPLVSGFARFERVTALEYLGRNGEALGAWEEILGRLPEGSGYAETGRKGRARVLIAMGRLDEAARALAEMRRDAISPAAAQWAEATLAEVERRRGRR